MPIKPLMQPSCHAPSNHQTGHPCFVGTWDISPWWEGSSCLCLVRIKIKGTTTTMSPFHPAAVISIRGQVQATIRHNYNYNPQHQTLHSAIHDFSIHLHVHVYTFSCDCMCPYVDQTIRATVANHPCNVVHPSTKSLPLQSYTYFHHAAESVHFCTSIQSACGWENLSRLSQESSMCPWTWGREIFQKMLL